MTGVSAAQIIGGNPRHGRIPLDNYPTPKEVTRALCNYYFPLPVEYGNEIWEPACGEKGAMSAELERSTRYTVFGTDVIYGLDFTKAVSDSVKPIIITNPPFFCAMDFIISAGRLSICKPVKFFALLLKSTFWHAKKRLWLFKELPPTAIHPLTWRPDFTNKGAPTMDVSWVVWNVPEGIHQRQKSWPVFIPMEKPQ